MRAALAAVAALTLAACGARSSAPAGAAEFIAEDSDFASFREWTSFQLPSTNPVSDLVYPAGARVAYLDQRPPRGATRYPNGTIIVKAIELGAGPSDWEIFARAKRGGDFNAAGAVGWEFFLLRIGADGRAHITSRGVAPTDDGRGPDMGLPSAAGGYFDSGAVEPCNVCHGDARRAADDYIWSEQLTPSATAE